MCKGTSHYWFSMVLLLATVSSTGCRNRGCYSCPGGTFSPLTGSTTIAPPATYSLNIPGMSNANSHQGPGIGLQLPMRQASNLDGGANGANGWRPIGALDQSNHSQSSGSDNRLAATVNQTQVVAVSPPGSVEHSQRVAQNLAPASGQSYIDNTNYRSTAVDVRQDISRLPVTDASQVRAPTSFNPTTTVGQFNAPYYTPQQQPQHQVPVQYQQPSTASQDPRWAQFPNVPVTSNVYSPNVVVGSFVSPTFSRPATQTYPGLVTQDPRVLAQSTVYADPNFASGWRDRDLTAGRDALNR